MYAKVSEKITLLVHAGMQTLVFSENFAHVLNDLLGNITLLQLFLLPIHKQKVYIQDFFTLR